MDRFKLSHHYQGSYFDPNDIFTPEEITEAGFVFVEFPTFIHRYDDYNNPIMKSYTSNPNQLPVCAKTYSLQGLRIKGLSEYFSKKNEFKPIIIEKIKQNKIHYVYKVSLCSSPVIYDNDFFFPVFVRGKKLPADK